MTTKKIKCFVAMAFGHRDSDKVYNNHIVKVLKGMGIESIRVDKRQHKDDLNNYIIRMLKESEIAIVDLTYARPSVYYEAGFAERNIPVIYTARKDHLNKSQPDDSLRVHFDLAMKKIIAWSNPDDKTFTSRFKQRLKYFLRPIIQERKDQSLLEADRQSFQSLSVTDRCDKIISAFLSKLKSKRFWARSFWKFRIFDIQNFAHCNGIIGVKKINKTYHFCFILVSETITKKQIETALYRVNGETFIETEKENSRFQNHYFFFATKGLPDSRLTSAFPHAVPMSHQHQFEISRDRYKGSSISFVYMFPSIDSNEKLKMYLQEAMATLSNRKTNRYTYATKDRHGSYDSFFLDLKK